MGDFCPLQFNWHSYTSLQLRHNGQDSVSNHQPHDCLLNRLFRHRSKKTSKLRVTGLCAGNSLGTGEFPAQMASNTENVSIWWRHHEMGDFYPLLFNWHSYTYTNLVITVAADFLASDSAGWLAVATTTEKYLGSLPWSFFMYQWWWVKINLPFGLIWGKFCWMILLLISYPSLFFICLP